MQALNINQRLEVDSRKVSGQFAYSAVKTNPLCLQFKAPCGAWVGHACGLGADLKNKFQREYLSGLDFSVERKA